MINIEINYQTKAPQKFKALFKKVARMVFHKLKLSGDLAVSVALVNSQRIKFLNKRYRAKNTITDVLSFPQTNEIIISYPRAKSQARARNHSLKRELSHLFCHGLLHLLGFDHQNKQAARAMKRWEEEILKVV